MESKANNSENGCQGIPAEVFEDYEKKFKAEEKNLLAQNVCFKHDLWEVCRQHSQVWQRPHVFNHKATELKPMTNQKSSGRCWIFACLNVIRGVVAKQFNVDDLEFSQNYLFFWDKNIGPNEAKMKTKISVSCEKETLVVVIERCNYLLECFVKTAKAGEVYDGRLISHLLHKPSEDGGQWDMLINLVEKYGIVLKTHFPDAQSAEASVRFGRIINNKMREFCLRLHKLVSEGKSDEEIVAEKKVMLQDIHRICSVCLGSPPETITWEYYDKEKTYRKIGPVKPVDFYREHIKPYFNMEDKICVVNDPRPNNKYDKLYTVDYLNNMTGGRKVLYINQPVEVLKQLATETIKSGECVWFGCDVGKCFSLKTGVLDLNIHNTDLVMGISLLGMTKAERLQYHESLMTHAMTFTAVHIEDEKPVRWRVENSWGDADGEKGFLVMTDEWFSEFVYEVVVDKKYLSDKMRDILSQTPIVLPAWDPMGALACKL